MKKIKLHIPVLRVNQRITYLNVDNINEIKNEIPDKEILDQYLIDQIQMVQAGKPFHSMKIQVGKDLFNKYLSILKRRSGGDFINKESIDIIYDNIPIIQIVS